MTIPEETPSAVSTPTSDGVEARRGALRRFGLPAACLVGGLALGSAFMPIGFANAQDDAAPAAADGEACPPDDHRGPARGARLEAVAELLGLEPSELREALAGGDATLAEVAEANGVSTEDLVAGLVAEAEERLDQAVADGKISEERADEIRDGLSERITERVTSVPERPRHRGHGSHDHGPGVPTDD